ncbi:MFS transporter [Pseudonocardia thermophila]|jgi:Na+/melibiose symporter and related transporters|uniref:MFS transporter n=1 Tax=Pseudonocardia thermophila TaxID=1848 RepID=UPI00248E3668|nr:MFS transporter [Pseudonocardia thermophila]
MGDLRSIRGPARRRELAAASVGNVVELFDWLLFASLAPYFAGALFPGEDPVAGLIYAYAVFAVGFVFRPLGAAVMGRVVDRRGRRFALLLSIAVTSLAALVIAVTPDYATIGIAAPIVVVLARLAQGLTISGEQSAAGTYLLEMAPPRHRFLFGAVSMAAVSVGQLLTLACVAALLVVYGPDGVAEGGWRLGFVACAVLGLVALMIRRLAPESEVFTERVATQRPPQLPILRRHKRQLLAVFLTIAPTSMGLYFVTAYLPVFFDQAGIADKASISGQLPLLTLYLIAVITLTGPVADRFGGLRVARIGNALLAVVTVPVIVAVTSGALPVVAGLLVYLTGLGIITAPVTVIGVSLFPAVVRGVGAGIPTAVSVVLFGGTFPLVAQSLTAAGNADLVPWLVGLGALLGFCGTVLARTSDIERSLAADGLPADRVVTGSDGGAV